MNEFLLSTNPEQPPAQPSIDLYVFYDDDGNEISFEERMRLDKLRSQANGKSPTHFAESSPDPAQPPIVSFIFYDDDGNAISFEERMRLNKLRSQANGKSPTHSTE